MAEKYETLKIKEKTYRRFKQIKRLHEFQDNKEYSMSDFLNYLLDLMKPARFH